VLNEKSRRDPGMLVGARRFGGVPRDHLPDAEHPIADAVTGATWTTALDIVDGILRKIAAPK
jgi:hypothetical protein